MGSACCVAASGRTIPNRTSSAALHRNARYSPSWSLRWENRGRVAGEGENSFNWSSQDISGNVGLENKDRIDVATEDVSGGQSRLENFQTPMWPKSPIHEGTAGNLRASVSDLSLGSNLSTEVKDLTKSSAVADPSLLKHSLSSITSTSSSSMSKADTLPSESHTHHDDTVLPRWAHLSPGHQPLRQISNSRILGLKSPNYNSVSEERQSFVLSMCSNNLTKHSHGGSSDGWSTGTFPEFVASSRRERWSFDSESLGSGHGNMTRSNSGNSVSSSIDLQRCGACSRLLTERSSWFTNELPVDAVLVCGHVFHAECLDYLTSEADRYDPTCPVCTAGEEQVLKMPGNGSRIEGDLKANRNRISRNRVMGTDLDDDSIVSDHRKIIEQGKGPRMEPSSSMRISFGRPFLKRHFSLGSKTTRSLSENNSGKRKGFWGRYSRE